MTCSICLGVLVQPVTMPCCKNSYCSACLTEWKEVRTVCPLCCSEIDGGNKNKLKEEQREDFDDGLLILETEMAEVRGRVNQVYKRVAWKREQANICKSMMPSNLINYLEKEIERVRLYHNCMEEQALLHNRAETVEYIQLIAETVLQIENSLETGVCFEEYEDFDNDEYFDDYEEEEGCYDEYDHYEEEYQASCVKKPKGKKFGAKVGGEQKMK